MTWEAALSRHNICATNRAVAPSTHLASLPRCGSRYCLGGKCELEGSMRMQVTQHNRRSDGKSRCVNHRYLTMSHQSQTHSLSDPMQLKSINSIHSYFAYTVKSRVKRDGLTAAVSPIKLVIIGNRHNGIGVIP